MHTIQAVVLDLDGTLLNARKQVTPRSLKAVRACHEQGMAIILATARPPRSVKQLLPDELLGLGWMLCYNGALSLHEASGTMHHLAIPGGTVRDVLDYLHHQQPETYIAFEIDDDMYSSRLLERHEVEVFGVPDDQPLPKPLTYEQLAERPVSKLLLPGTPGLYEGLQAGFGRRLQLVRTDQGQLLQLMAPGVSKAAALELAAKNLGIPLSSIMAFGDDYNDLSLFEPATACGWPVAMGNAIPELKARARLIAGHHDEDGVAVLLEQVLAARRN